jgi:hypothetical protein
MFTGNDFLISSLLRPGSLFQRSLAENPTVLAPQPVQPDLDTIRSDTYAPPFSSPNDLDDYGRETDEMRRAYRDFHRKEPAVRAAIEGMVASIADTDIAVLPDDEDHPEDCRAAEFVNYTVENSPHGWDGLIRRVLLAALIDGFSVSEKVLHGVENHRRWGGFWGLKHVKNKDTAHLRLRLDVYRNVVGVVNTTRGISTYPARKVILFTHADIYDNPFGSSELRSAYRACQLIGNAYELWAYALTAHSGPFLKGTVSKNERRFEMEAALQAARSGGYIVVPTGDNVDLVNLATASSFDAFERKIDKLREEIFIAIRGAYLPFMQGSGGGGETRGSADVSKGAGSDPRERVIARAVGRCLTQQLCTDLVVPNFGTNCGIPRIILGGTDWAETKTQLEVAKSVLNDFRMPISKAWLYKNAQTPPPTSDEDAIQPQQAPTAPTSPFGFSGGTANKFADGEAAVMMPLNRLQIDPVRFQFRPRTNADGTVSDPPRARFEPDRSPPLLIWRDPQDGKDYVVDGHHRHAWASRDNAACVPVKWLKAPDAETAKAIGWRINSANMTAPGPPPRPGLEWKEETKRWVRADTGEEHQEPTAGDNAKSVSTEKKLDGETSKRREEEDAEHEGKDAKLIAEADRRSEARDKEDSVIEKLREKEDASHEKKSSALEKEQVKRESTRDKQDAAIEKTREKEDAEPKKRLASLEAEQTKRDSQREKEDAAAEKTRAKEDDDHDKKEVVLDKEQEIREAQRDKEDAINDGNVSKETQDARDKEDAAHEEKKAKIDKEKEDRETGREAEDREIEKSRGKEDAEHNQKIEQIEKELEEREAKRDEEDTKIQAARDAEDAQHAAAEKELEFEQQEREAKRDEEDAERDRLRAQEDAEHDAKVKELDDLRVKRDFDRDEEDQGTVNQDANRDVTKRIGPTAPLQMADPAPADGTALPGTAGKRLVELLGQAIQSGQPEMARIVESLTRRALNTGQVAFTDGEQAQLVEAITRAVVPAELLGRARIQRFAELAANREPVSFSDSPRVLEVFADPLPPLTTRWALDYFQKLVPKLGLDPERYGALMERHAMTLAEATKLTTVNKVQAAITKYLGTDWLNPPAKAPSGAQVVQQVLDNVGVSPKNPQYAEMVFRTNVMDSYHAGASRQMETPAIQEAFPVWEYLGIQDGREGDDHRPKFGKYYPTSASFAAVRGDRPFNCRCSSAPVPAARWADLQARGAQAETEW